MSWNYRIIKTNEGYSIYEVYYDENGEATSITEKPIINFYCDTIEDLKQELEVIKKAFESPLINRNKNT